MTVRKQKLTFLTVIVVVDVDHIDLEVSIEIPPVFGISIITTVVVKDWMKTKNGKTEK